MDFLCLIFAILAGERLIFPCNFFFRLPLRGIIPNNVGRVPGDAPSLCASTRLGPGRVLCCIYSWERDRGNTGGHRILWFPLQKRKRSNAPTPGFGPGQQLFGFDLFSRSFPFFFFLDTWHKEAFLEIPHTHSQVSTTARHSLRASFLLDDIPGPWSFFLSYG
jgi:hypothetical protein